MPVSIRDVARLAGVSVTTVSRVVNDRLPVGKETRKKVLAAMATLEWTPRDGVHRIDSNQRVGVLVDGFDSYVSYGYAAGTELLELVPR